MTNLIIKHVLNHTLRPWQDDYMSVYGWGRLVIAHWLSTLGLQIEATISCMERRDRSI
jgi:hypothetical protein